VVVWFVVLETTTCTRYQDGKAGWFFKIFAHRQLPVVFFVWEQPTLLWLGFRFVLLSVVASLITPL
jgi:hypothetical protein